MRLVLFLHLVAAAYWVGGMAFAMLALRPALGTLPPPERLALFSGVLQRFLGGVLIALVVVLASGATMVVQAGGFAAFGAGLHVMATVGVVMTVVYAVLRLRTYPALTKALAAGDLPSAGAAAGRIRHLVAVNLVLGIVAFLAGAFAR